MGIYRRLIKVEAEKNFTVHKIYEEKNSSVFELVHDGLSPDNAGFQIKGCKLQMTNTNYSETGI
jgi:hypothetical protein